MVHPHQDERVGEDILNPDNLCAGILYLMSIDLETMFNPKGRDATEVTTKLESLLVKGCKIPGFDIKDIKTPVLGPLPGEHLLEKYNRANTLLKSVRHMLAASRWRGLFVTSTDPHRQHLCSGSLITKARRDMSAYSDPTLG